MSLVFAFAGLCNIVFFKTLPESLVLFLFAVYMDYVDGVLARYTNSVSARGAYLDGISDRFVEAMIIVSLMLYGIPDIFVSSNILLLLLLFFGTTMTSYVRVYADHKKLVTDKNELVRMGGLLERFERVSLLLLSMFLSLVYGVHIISYMVIVLIVLSSITVFQRINYSLTKGKK